MSHRQPSLPPGSICPLVEKRQVLFLGDAVLNNVVRLSRPLMWDRAKRLQLDASLHSLRGPEAQVVCFGHSPPLAEEVMTRIQRMTHRPYDLPTWRIVLRNRRTLRRFQASRRWDGHWEGGPG